MTPFQQSFPNQCLDSVVLFLPYMYIIHPLLLSYAVLHQPCDFLLDLLIREAYLTLTLESTHRAHSKQREHTF